jgi:hypothetical protein
MSRSENQFQKSVSEITGRFYTILGRLGYKEDSTYNMTSQPEVAKNLGLLLYDYMVATIYDCSFEGWSEQELQGFYALLKDMDTFQKNR